LDELKETLHRIEYQIEDASEYFHFNEAATVNEILDLEAECGFVLPKSYRKFLNYFNGGFISAFPVPAKLSFESARWNSNILMGTEEIRAEYEKLSTRRWKISSKNYNPYPFIPFCRTSENELLIFVSSPNDKNESHVFDAFHEEWPESWGCLYPSFIHLLNDYLVSNGGISKISNKPPFAEEYLNQVLLNNSENICAI
jgi:hypothetical protein